MTKNKTTPIKVTKVIKPVTNIEIHPAIDTVGDFTTDNDLLDIDGALSDAMNQSDSEKDQKIQALADKASKKRMEVREIKKEIGIKAPVKISQFPTRSHAFLGEKVSDRGVHFILNQLETEIYKDGADVAPRILMGIPAYGKSCKKSAFEHLMNAQEKLRDARGEDPTNAPKWIIITNDSSMITDRNLLTRLDDLLPNTKVAAPFGFNQIRASGKWYAMEKGDITRGSYQQCNLENTNWNFIVGQGFTEKPKYRTVIAGGPFIAVRGELFLQIDFKYMKDHSELGYYHYMADISLECEKRGFMVAQINSSAIQFDELKKHINDREVQVDQSCFTSKWQSMLPKSFNLAPNK